MIALWSADVARVRHALCVVGSGPAGLTLAMETARLGRPVLVLESGGDRPGPAQDLSDAEIVDPKRHDSLRIAVARRLGGTSNLWGARCMPLDPCDFEPRPFAGDARWPIAYADLAPFYEPACAYASCGAPAFESAPAGLTAEDPAFGFASLERASNQPKFHKAHRRELVRSTLIDLRLQATVVGVEWAESGGLAALIVAGPDGARARLEADRFVLAAGGLESTRLLLAAQRASEEKFGGRDGPLGRHYMGHIIGEIADVVFADDKTEAAFDFFRDGHGSWARRRFTPSLKTQIADVLPNVGFWPVVPPIADPRHGSGALSAVAVGLSLPGVSKALLPEAIRTRHLDGPVAFGPHLANVLRDGPRTAAFLARFAYTRYLGAERISGYFVRNPARRYGLSYHSEQSPRADSRVSLGAATDRFGLPRLSIDLKFNADDLSALARAHRKFAQWFERAGFGRVEFRQPPERMVEALDAKAAHGTHQIGLTRMGADRRTAVVDGDLRCFDAPNLYVASSSVFPTSGQANPTLTIVALSVRLARHLARTA